MVAGSYKVLLPTRGISPGPPTFEKTMTLPSCNPHQSVWIVRRATIASIRQMRQWEFVKRIQTDDVKTARGYLILMDQQPNSWF